MILAYITICFISDHLIHDVGMEYHVMKLTIEHVKSKISQEIGTAHYFSDGCAAIIKTANTS